MTKLYQKDPLFFALACICIYVCTFSTSESVSARLGAPYLFTVLAGGVLCLVLGSWIRHQGLAKFSRTVPLPRHGGTVSLVSPPGGAGRLQPVARGAMEFSAG